jgi:phytoene desaturase
MYKIIEGIVDELKKKNVKFTYNTEIVDYISNGNKLGCLIDKNNYKWSADVILINADAAVFRSRIFKRKKYSEEKLDKMNWTMGCLTFYTDLKCKLPEVNHHNYFLGSNYKEYANKLLQNPGTLQKPYYYVNVLSKYNSDCAPEGCESLFFVCPNLNLQYKPNWDDKETIVNNIIADFSKRINKDIVPEIVSKTIYTPIDWQNQFNLYHGSSLGLSHTMDQIGVFRPSNFDEKFKNVFYVGASTIPGAGIPIVIISSKLAFERVEKYSKLN